jgi:hypothetical protein
MPARGGWKRLGLTQVQADEYYSTADRVRRGLLRAIAYRESTGQLGSVHAVQPANGAGGAATPLN